MVGADLYKKEVLNSIIKYRNALKKKLNIYSTIENFYNILKGNSVDSNKSSDAWSKYKREFDLTMLVTVFNRSDINPLLKIHVMGFDLLGSGYGLKTAYFTSELSEIFISKKTGKIKLITYQIDDKMDKIFKSKYVEASIKDDIKKKKRYYNFWGYMVSHLGKEWEIYIGTKTAPKSRGKKSKERAVPKLYLLTWVFPASNEEDDGLIRTEIVNADFNNNNFIFDKDEIIKVDRQNKFIKLFYDTYELFKIEI
ncbi:MAG: hypothetical protein ACTSRP_21945 [Candidatus Helarchaeota archaeon]